VVRELLRESIVQATLSPLTRAWSKPIDKALPGPHTKALYENCKRKAEAKALAQLRTGASRLNEYLVKIKATESSKCGCRAERVGLALSICVPEVEAAETGDKS
jgi:hypothetical protein